MLNMMATRLLSALATWTVAPAFKAKRFSMKPPMLASRTICTMSARHLHRVDHARRNAGEITGRLSEVDHVHATFNRGTGARVGKRGDERWFKSMELTPLAPFRPAGRIRRAALAKQLDSVDC